MDSNVVLKAWHWSDQCNLCCNLQMYFQFAKIQGMPSLLPEKSRRGRNNRRPRGTFGSCCVRLGSRWFVCRGRLCWFEHRCGNQWSDLWGKTCNRLWMIYLVRSSTCRPRILYKWFRLCRLGSDRLGMPSKYRWHCRNAPTHTRCRWLRLFSLLLYLIYKRHMV